MELKSKLTNSLVERDSVIKQLKETVIQEKKEIQNQYKVQSCIMFYNIISLTDNKIKLINAKCI